MKGSYHITVQNKRIRYDFEIRRNITVIRGDSATGKTTLIDMVQEYYENGIASAVMLRCDKPCTVLSGKTWSAQLSMMQDSIVFIDEGNDFVLTDAFASAIRNTDNYYVIVTREGIPSLPYSVNEIYGIRNSGKYGTLKQTYNVFYHLYEVDQLSLPLCPSCVITEDSNSGYQFYKNVCGDRVNCLSAYGKSNIFGLIVSRCEEDILIIADGAAFGSEMEKVSKLMQEHPNIHLYLPESFEWLILQSGLISQKDLKKILAHPEEYIESRDYFSWERYFTQKLTMYTQDTFLKYNKRQLNPAYWQEKTADQILGVMQGIKLK